MRSLLAVRQRAGRADGPVRGLYVLPLGAAIIYREDGARTATC